MSDLGNHTVITHMRYQYISPIPGRVLACVGIYSALCPCGGDVPPQDAVHGAEEVTLLQSLPVLNGPCAIKHGDHRVMFPERTLPRCPEHWHASSCESANQRMRETRCKCSAHFPMTKGD